MNAVHADPFSFADFRSKPDGANPDAVDLDAIDLNPDDPPAAQVDSLDAEIVSLSCHISQATYRLLVLIRAFDERFGWSRWGFTSCAHWLHWRCDLSLGAAHERVRIAHALPGLPVIARAFAAGQLSYSKVRALSRVATPDNETELVAFAMTTTAARLEERCRQMRNCAPGATALANRAHAGRRLESWHDRVRDVVVVTVELPKEQGELLLAAVDKAVENAVATGADASGPEFGEVSWSAQRADALMALANDYLGRAPLPRESERDCAADESAAVENAVDESAAAARPVRASSSADRYQVVVHVDAQALSGGEGRADLPLESVRRLACDGSIIEMTDGPNGEPLDLGRKRRTVSAALRRALWARDGGCTFPGCTNRHFVDAHHVQHWCEGGRTSLDNTLLLCGAHHRLVHEGGYEILPDRDGRWYFRRPDGRAVPPCGYTAHRAGFESSAEDLRIDAVRERGTSYGGSKLTDFPWRCRHG